MKKRLFLTLRIIIATFAAILTAKWLQLDFCISAGIVAILSVLSTKVETIQTAFNRFIAFGIAIVISYCCYLTLGFNVYAFLVYIVFFATVCQLFGWTYAIAMDSVLISHFIEFKSMEFPFLYNELCLFVIGVASGIIINLCLHSHTDYMNALKSDIDNQIRLALLRMSNRIMDANFPNYDGLCFTKMRSSVNEALLVAKENQLNQLFFKNTKDIDYINMRINQIELLYEMYKIVKDIKTTPFTSKMLSNFLSSVSSEYSENNPVTKLFADLEKLQNTMKEQELPKDRTEFEDRAKLYVLMQYLHNFLQIKMKFMEFEK